MQFFKLLYEQSRREFGQQRIKKKRSEKEREQMFSPEYMNFVRRSDVSICFRQEGETELLKG